MYGGYQKLGSIFLIHDWGEELNPKRVNIAMEKYGFQPLYQEFAEHIGTSLRAFKKVADSTELYPIK